MSSPPQRKRWLPLEANPDVVTDFAASLGADVGALRFCDVFSLDEVSVGAARFLVWWEARGVHRFDPRPPSPPPPPDLLTQQDMLAFVPRPVAAVVLLFPITPAYERARKEGEKRRGGRGGCFFVGIAFVFSRPPRPRGSFPHPPPTTPYPIRGRRPRLPLLHPPPRLVHQADRR